MIGAAIGIIFGLIQFSLLFFAVKSITQQQIKLLPLLGQFFCPLAALLLCALVCREQLLVCAICIISILLLGALVNIFIQLRKKER